ncbi:hypothetical protein, partial [Collinsella stercoris]|uniref:hypothetical protein n=1 Tax=Collinsella stercoris TaxID=147206 RepID=UPI0023EFC918
PDLRFPCAGRCGGGAVRRAFGAAAGHCGGSARRRRGARAFGAAQVSNTREFAQIAPGFQASTRRVAILLPNTESFFSRILRKRQTNFRYWEAFLEMLE